MASSQISINANLSASTNDGLCLSKTCIETASSILESINMNIDPCSDFYKYTCGNWIKNTIIPEESAGFGILEIESNKNREQMRVLLEGTYREVLRSTRSLSSFQIVTEESRRVDRNNFRILKNYYESCIETGLFDQVSLSYFFQEIYKLRADEIYKQEENDSIFQITAQQLDIIAYPKSEGLIMDVGGLFTLEMYPDDNDRTNMALTISAPAQEDEPMMLQAGRDTLFDLMFSLFGTDNSTKRDLSRSFELEEAGLAPLTESEIYSMVDNAMFVQTSLIELAKLSMEEDGGASIYTIDEAKVLFPLLDFHDIFQSHDIPNRPLKVYIYDEAPYFSELMYFSNIMDESRSINRNSLMDFMLVHKTLREAPRLDNQVRMLFPDSPFQTRSSLCVDDVLDKFSLLAGRFYAMLSFREGEQDRLLLDSISENIKSALHSRIEMADWLDSDTRDAAIKKLNFMEKTVGYSTSSPDQRSPHEINEFANGLEMDAENFYENERSVRQWTLKHYWSTLGRPIGRTEWLGVSSPQVINAFNLLSKNSIFVSTGFAQKPNFDSKYPDYINYAAIGQTLGHEYSHGFDDFGSQYDELGIERNWWSDEVLNKYVEKSECFTKQYSKATIRDDDGNKYHIDGALTLGENIADNEGLAAAYHAYKVLKDSGKSFDPVLPGLHQFSPEALFFISAGRSFCSKPLSGTLADAIHEEHAPDSIRANSVFQNSEDFSRVFHCPVGSKMNPKNKCKIW